MDMQNAAGSLAEVSTQEDANLFHGEHKELAAVSLMMEHEKHSVNDTKLGCRHIRLQCRGSSHAVTIRRALTVGQIAGNIGSAIVFIGYLALQVLQAIAISNARLDAFNGGGMSATNVMLVHQHGLFGSTTNVAPLTYSSKAAVCSSITVDALTPGKETTRVPLATLLAKKNVNVDWPSADALAAAACQVLELDLDAMPKSTIEAYVNACSQHSRLCGNPGLCFYSQHSKTFKGTNGKGCPASKIVDVHTKLVKGKGPFLRTSFGRPQGPDFGPADSHNAPGSTVASWPAGGSASGSFGLVVSVQDLQLGERCVMSLNSQQIQQKFSNLLSPRGLVVLDPKYKVHRVELRAGRETGTPSGCSWGYAKECGKGLEICGEAKTVAKCGTIDKVFQNQCCPGTKNEGLVEKEGIMEVADPAGEFTVRALTHAVKVEPARSVALQKGDVILAVGGAGLKAGECVVREATVPLMQNWLYGMTPIILWIGRRA